MNEVYTGAQGLDIIDKAQPVLALCDEKLLHGLDVTKSGKFKFIDVESIVRGRR